ncbi:MAG TPA: helix-turn-helix domain-containing protein [Gemmatimonadaceae bacterium]|jgi:AraC-like DNA-binding protein
MAAGNLPHRRPGETSATEIPGAGLQARVAALVLGRLERARLQDAVRGRAILEHVDTASALENLVARSVPRVSAVIAEPFDIRRVPVAPTLARLRAEYPGVALIGFCQPAHRFSSEIVALVNAGVHELVFRGVDDSSTAFRQTLARASQTSAARQVLDALGTHLTGDALPIVETCLQYAWPDFSSRALAQVLGMNVKTLVKQCRTNGLPSPGALLNWLRLMVVAYLLEAEGRALEHVAAAFGLDSASPLRNLMKRYTGLRSLEVRTGGGLKVVIEAFLREDAFGRQEERPHGEEPLAG